MNKTSFGKGLQDGIPIGLGYFAVSFTFGIMAIQSGLTAWQAVLISLTNLTSAGQFAGIGIIAAGGSLWEMALTQLVINLRYCLMSFSLSQKLEKGVSNGHRLAVAFGVTDEIFGVSASQEGRISPWYNYGVMCVAIPGWTLGTLAGAVSGSLLPDFLVSALSVAIYGMFLAVIIPPAKKNRAVLGVVIGAMAVSTLFAVVPVLNKVSTGFVIIITTLLVAGLAAHFCPVEEKETEEKEAANLDETECISVYSGDGRRNISDSYASTGPFQKGDHQSVCKILSVLCAICMSCSYDISGNPDSNGRRDHFRCGGTHCSTDRGIS